MLNVNLLIENLTILASETEQRRYWLPNGTNEMSLLDEQLCGIFDDAGLTRAIDTGWLAKNFSEEFCKKVKSLKKALTYVPYDQAPEIIIEHPRMPEVRKLSKELLGLLDSANSETS